jgi:hypothetical protein
MKIRVGRFGFWIRRDCEGVRVVRHVYAPSGAYTATQVWPRLSILDGAKRSLRCQERGH